MRFTVRSDDGCAYNVAHSYVSPMLLGAALFSAGAELEIPLLGGAHIGFDRTLGYGLKYPSAFGDTHLGRIGRAASVQAPGPT